MGSDEVLYGADLFGEPIRHSKAGPLAERFEFPPFSVLNAREGEWQERKRAWIALGIQSEIGRPKALLGSGGGNSAAAAADLARRYGVSEEKLAKVHSEGLEATKHIGTEDPIEVTDYATRHKYLVTGYEVRGMLREDVGTRNVNILVVSPEAQLRFDVSATRKPETDSA